MPWEDMTEEEREAFADAFRESCAHCNEKIRRDYEEPYFGLHWNRSFHPCCSQACADALGVQIEERTLAKRLASRNRSRAEDRRWERKDLACQHCGAPVVTARKSKRYCSTACRQKAYRERLAEA